MALPKRDAGARRYTPKGRSDAAQRKPAPRRKPRPTPPPRTDTLGNRPAAAPRPRAPRPSPARDLGRTVGRLIHDPLGALGLPSAEAVERAKKTPKAERDIQAGRTAGPPAPYVNIRAERTNRRRKVYPATAFDVRTGRTVEGSVSHRGEFRPAKPTEFDAVNDFLGDLVHRMAKTPLVTTGGGPVIPGQKRKGRTIAALTPRAVPMDGNVGGRIIEDLLSIPALAPSAVFELANATGALTTGNTKPAGRLVDSLGEAAIVKLLSGDVKGAQKAAEEHPGYAVLDLLGLKGALGRTGGAVARHAPSKTLNKIGSTARPSLQVYKDIRVDRNYSPDLIDKGIQALVDHLTVVAPNRRKGRADHQLTGARLRRALERDVAETMDINIESIKRGRDEEKRTAGKTLPKDKENPVAALQVEGRALPKTFRRDLEGILARLDAEEPRLRDRPNKLEMNREQAKAIRRTLDSDLDPAESLAKLMPYIRRSNELEEEMVRLGYLEPQRQEAAKLAPAKIEHLGAEPTPEGPRILPRPTKKTHDLTGRPDLRASEARWFHGTQGDFDRVTADHGGPANLGAFLTSDPKLAAFYTGERVHGSKGTPRIYEVRVRPKKTLDIRLGTEDREGLGAVGERLLERARALEDAYLDGRLGVPADASPSRTIKILESYLEGLRTARTVDEWKANEAKLYDAAMRIGRAEGDPGFGGERSLREELRALGYDSIRKGDDGADTLVALTDDILEPVDRHDPNNVDALAKQEPRRIPNQDVRELMALLGQDDVAFLTHRPFLSGRGKNFQGSGGKAEDRGQISSRVRTGEATQEGATPLGREYLTDELASKRVKVETIKAVNRVGNRYATAPDGGFATPTLAREAADAITRSGGPEMEVISLHPTMLASKASKRAVDEHIDLDGLEEQMHRLGLKMPDRDMGAEGDGPYALIPRAVAQQLREFEKLTGQGGTLKFIELFTSHFRQVVLFTSTRWLMGNGTEAALRMVSAGINPAHIALGRSLMKPDGAVARAAMRTTDPDAYAEAAVQLLTGGGFGAQAKRFDRVRRSDQMDPDTWAHTLTRAMEAAMDAPPGKQLGEVWKVWKAGFTTMNVAFERALEYGAIGKAATADIRALNKSATRALTLQDEAIEDLAKGLLDSEKQRQFARTVDEIRGRYSKLKPREKQAVLYYAPFAMWYINALKFCLVTMPVKRPIQTSLLAAYAETHKDLRDTQAALKKDAYFMRGAVEIDGAMRPLQRYLPFGALSADPLAQPASFILPQFNALKYWAGIDFANRALLVDGQPATDGDRLAMGLWSIVDTVAPFAIPAKTVLRKAGKAEAGWNPIETKAGSEFSYGEGLRKAFDPLYPYGKRPTAKAPARSEAPAPAPTSRREELLERRGELLQDRQARSTRRQEILERLAAIRGG